MPKHFIFRYSFPFEAVVAKTAGIAINPEDFSMGRKKAEVANTIWNEYEAKVMNLFAQMYKTPIHEVGRAIYLSQILKGSFSAPLTISIMRIPDIDSNEESKKSLISYTIHELAHHFMLNRANDTFVNKLFKKVQDNKIGDDSGTQAHFLVQAVEFGIDGELFGENYARDKRTYKIEKSYGEYQTSAKLLLEHNVPLDKTCLEYIEKKVLGS